MTTLVVPMAGMGSRFRSAGYLVPKPLLPIGPFKMYEVVLANLYHPSFDEIVLVTMRGMLPTGAVYKLERCFSVEVRLIELDERTDGAARTVQIACQNPGFKLDDPLVIANSDQYIAGDVNDFFSRVAQGNNLVLTMRDTDPKWSYVKLGASGLIEQVVEKKVISNEATVGVYGFSSAETFLAGFSKMETLNDRVNGELYVAPVYNYLTEESRGRIVNLGNVGDVMHGLGVPDDFENFVSGATVIQAISRTASFMDAH